MFRLEHWYGTKFVKAFNGLDTKQHALNIIDILNEGRNKKDRFVIKEIIINANRKGYTEEIRIIKE